MHTTLEPPATMRRIRGDLWETRSFSPFDGLTTHAYLWTPPAGANVLFYATGDAADLDHMEALGGVGHQYLSHRDEAGPALRLVAERFGAVLHAPAAEVDDIAPFSPVDVALAHRHVDEQGVEVVPTPGHSPGSTCYLVPGAGGETYLFTGDTILLGRRGRWVAGNVPGVSEPVALAASLRLLATLAPDLVVSSAYTGDAGAHAVRAADWPAFVDEALESLEG